MPPSPADFAAEEYRALRATIRERGTARLVTALSIFVAWGALVLGVQAWWPIPLATLIPLIVLSAGFETVFALHIGVERIGRYLQAYYEETPNRPPAWEQAAMTFGQIGSRGSLKVDPLYSGLFAAAALLNLVGTSLVSLDRPIVLGTAIQFLLCGCLHGLFVLRVWRARRSALGQREADLEHFQRLRHGGM